MEVVPDTNQGLLIMEDNEKKNATGWLIATYIFAILGGLLGVAIGASVAFNKSYKDSHRVLGFIGVILSAVSMFVWKTMAS